MVLFALFFTTTAYAASCQNMASFAPSCTGGSIVQDTTVGTCRTIKCASATSSMQVSACSKPDGKSPQFFELYKQAVAGTGITKVCLGSTCVGEFGFAKSALFTCDGVTDTPTNTPVCTPTTEVCDGKDNNCNSQIDENGVCTPVTCTSNALTAPITCAGGSITKDIVSGTCRNVVCVSGSNSITTAACNKGSYYEVYRQAYTGSPPKVCFGAACVQQEGFAKSTACTGSTPACTPTTEVCDGKDNNCNAQTDENNVCTLACVPKTEMCDGKDNDCDGQVDEGNVCAPVCVPATEVCDGKDNNCNGQTDENNVCTSTSKYPLKTNIVSTQFWVGQSPSADTGWSHNYDSAWDTWWMEHYGGFDDPNNRNGWHPAAFTPKENPFYVAIPYTDFSNVGRKSNAFQVVPWANEKANWGYQESLIKNRWVKVIKGSKTVYAQVENSGPGPTDDWQYVFGSNPQPTTDFGWKAGIDVSPAIRDYLGLGPVDVVSWQWVNAADVPAGPWKNIVTTRQSCWASTICP